MSCEEVLPVDTSNAFDELSLHVALSNIKSVMSSLATVLANTNRGYAALFADSETIYSRESIAQEDPLLLLSYALATLSMIVVEDMNGEVWHIDDATGGSRITKL